MVTKHQRIWEGVEKELATLRATNERLRGLVQKLIDFPDPPDGCTEKCKSGLCDCGFHDWAEAWEQLENEARAALEPRHDR